MHDVKSREVPNSVWALAYPVGCTLTAVMLVYNVVNVEMIVLSVGFAVGVGFVLCYFGFFGGADLKALIFVALTVPGHLTVFKPVNSAGLPVVLTMFCNSAVLSLIYPFAVFTLNIIDWWRGKKMFEDMHLTVRERMRLLFTTRKISIEKLENTLAYFPLETVVNQNGKPTRKILRFVRAETDLSQLLAILKANKHMYKDGVLATPTVPYIVFFTLGLAVTLFGNLATGTISYFLGDI